MIVNNRCDANKHLVTACSLQTTPTGPFMLLRYPAWRRHAAAADDDEEEEDDD